MLKKLLLGFVVLTMAGCASQLLKPDQLSKDQLTGNNGALVGSFSRNPNGPPYYSQTFMFRNVDTNKIYRIHSQQEFNIFSGKTPDEFKTENNSGSTFVFQLPAGKYILYNFSLYRPYGVAYFYYSSKTDFAIPFVVQPNKVNYLGELKLESTGKNFLGMSMPAGGIWIISNQIERDISLIKATMPNLPLESVVSVIPKTKDIFTPLVVLPDEAKQINPIEQTTPLK